MRHRGGKALLLEYWGKPLSVILSDFIIWLQFMEKRWQCIEETTPCLSRMRSWWSIWSPNMKCMLVGRGGVESETEGGGGL